MLLRSPPCMHVTLIPTMHITQRTGLKPPCNQYFQENTLIPRAGLSKVRFKMSREFTWQIFINYTTLIHEYKLVTFL